MPVWRRRARPLGGWIALGQPAMAEIGTGGQAKWGIPFQRPLEGVTESDEATWKQGDENPANPPE